MHINTKKNISRKRNIIIVVCSVILTMCGILTYTELSHTTDIIKNPFYKPVHTMSTAEKNNEATKNDPTTTGKKSIPSEGVSQSQSTNDVPIAKTMSISITQLNQDDNNVYLSAMITNPAKSGTCTFTFTAEGTKPVVSQSVATDNSCSTSVPNYQFSMVGDWQVKVNYFANNTITSTTGSITIQ